MSGTVHVLGAGLSGLSAALSLSAAGRKVVIHEAAPRAGGRCRSYHDLVLDRVIDNGNHLMMSANAHTFAYLDEIGARDRVQVTAPAAYPFFDVATGERWTLRPNAGRFPWWIFSKTRRVAGTGAADYLAGWKLLRAGANETVADCLSTKGPLWDRFWEPLSVAALNIDPARGAARLLANTCRLTFAKGEAACRPVIVRQSLAHALIDPAVEELQRRGVALQFGDRVKGLVSDEAAISGIECTSGTVEIGPEDRVICALPSWIVADLPISTASSSSGLTRGSSSGGEYVAERVSEVPVGHAMILNLHFRLPHVVEGPPVQGLTGSLAQWLFLKDDIASVTVSAADAFAEADADDLAAGIWPEVAAALDLASGKPPVFRVVKEKRATFAQTPANERLRPPPLTRWRNLVMAGDWTDTGLPATIEGAIQSGRSAAQVIL